MSAALTTNPNYDLILLLVGIFLIYMEANRPGKVIYGCFGLLGVLFACYGLSHLHFSRHAPLEVLIALASLSLGIRFRFYGIWTLCAGALLFVSLAHLTVDAQVHWPVALVVASLFTSVTDQLARIALLARRNKIHSSFPTIPPSPAKPDPAE